MTSKDILTLVFLSSGAFFFMAGSVGLLRFPDVFTRLHALTKCDNLGLGLVLLGLAVHGESWTGAGRLLVIWLVVMLSSTTACHLVARTALRQGLTPWRAKQ